MGLSPQEKERLLNRPKNSKDRATNDVKVRKKLRAWLMDIPDIKLIFRYLPEEQLAKELTDDHAYLFLEFAERTLRCKEFGPIRGEVESSDNWKVELDDNKLRPAEDKDVIRSTLLHCHIDNLQWFAISPIAKAQFLSKIDSDPELHNRVTDEERKGIKRIDHAIEEYTWRQAHPGAEPYPDNATMWDKAKAAAKKQ